MSCESEMTLLPGRSPKNIIQIIHVAEAVTIIRIQITRSTCITVQCMYII